MKVPVSRCANIKTGEIVIKYADVDEIQLANAFIRLFNQAHPGGGVQALEGGIT